MKRFNNGGDLIVHFVFIFITFLFGVAWINGKELTIEPLPEIIGWFFLFGGFYLISSDVVEVILDFKQRRSRKNDAGKEK